MSGDCWVDLYVRETDTFIVSKRIMLMQTGPRSHDFYSDGPTAGNHARCKTHNIKVEITERQAMTINDSAAFCQMCQDGEPPVQQKPDPLVGFAKLLNQAASCAPVRSNARSSNDHAFSWPREES